MKHIDPPYPHTAESYLSAETMLDITAKRLSLPCYRNSPALAIAREYDFGQAMLGVDATCDVRAAERATGEGWALRLLAEMRGKP